MNQTDKSPRQRANAEGARERKGGEQVKQRDVIDRLTCAIDDALQEAQADVRAEMEKCGDNAGGRLAIIRNDYLPIIAGLTDALEKLIRAGYQG